MKGRFSTSRRRVVTLLFPVIFGVLTLSCVGSGGTDARSGDRWANLQANLTFGRAEQYYAERRYGQAINEYRLYLDRYPDMHNADDASFRIAQSLEGLGERMESADVYRAMGLLYPRSSLAPSAHLRAGEIFELEGRWDEALYDYGYAAEYEETEPGRLAALRLADLKARRAEKRAAIEEEKLRRRDEKIAERAAKKAAGISKESASQYLMEVILGENE